MVDFKYLYQGLCGMARAHRANAMAGHLGAAVVAGYFIGEDLPELDDQVYSSIERELDRVVKGDEAFWYDAKKQGISIPELFQPFPKEKVQKKIDDSSIAKALANNIGELRQSGHNVIFASIAIRALRGHTQFATEAIVSGVEKLIARFDDQGPGRGYYGKQRGWIEGEDIQLGPDTDFPAYGSLQKMIEVVIDELIRTASMYRRGYGGPHHLINHAAALTELARFGYTELAQQGLAAHHHHLRLIRSLPELSEELGVLKPAAHDPRKPEHWKQPDSTQWGAHLTHRVKTIYGFHTLLRFVESEEKKKQAQEKFLYLMG